MRYTTIAALMVGVALGGCESTPKADGAAGSAVVVPPTVAQGYALLYDLVSRQKDVSKILILKSASDPTKAIVSQIAELAGKMTVALESWAKTDGLSLERISTGLPAFEMDTRDGIQGSASRYLLFGGDDFEVKLIYTQMNACEYGAAMARNLAGRDGVSDERRDALRAFAKGYDEVFGALSARLATVKQ